MSTSGWFWRRLWFLLRRGRLDRELLEEMRQHAALKMQKNLAAGMDPEEARYAAQRQLGNMTRQQEESRSNWGFPLVDGLVQDIRYALRGLRKAPGFTTVALLTLALGIGAATAIFSIVNTVLLRPLPYRHSERLVQIWTVTPVFPGYQMGQSKPDFDQIHAQSHSFETLALYQSQRLGLTGEGEPEQILTAAVSSDFLDLFSIQPALGRRFQPSDEELKNGKVILLSHGLWQRRFAGDPDVVGRPITLDQQPYTVVGVLPKGFAYPGYAEAWVPLVITGQDLVVRTNWKFMSLGRLRPSVSIRSAQNELDQISARLAHQFPEGDANVRFQVASLQKGVIGGGTRSELATLAGAVTFLLLISCANVSNLILSRSAQRGREIAVRAALGASQKRILRQLLVESCLLAFSGGLAGIWLAGVGIGAFHSIAPAGFARLREVHMEPGVALIAFIVSSLAGVLCGLAPALHTSRANLTVALNERTTGSGAARHGLSLRGFLAASQVAFALVLLTGSALMVQSLTRLMKVDTGFRTDHLLTAEIDTAKARYPSLEAHRLLVQRLLQTLRAEPQFSGVAISNRSLMTGSSSVISFDPETVGSKEKNIALEVKSVSPGYFAVMGIPMIAGRSFNDRDTKGAPQVAMINDSLARRFFSGQDPVGKFLTFGPEPESRYQIIGVTADTRDIHVKENPRLEVYFALLQDPYGSLHVMVRSASDPLLLVKLLQQRVWSVDKDQPLTKVSSMTQVIAQSLEEPRFRTSLLAVFAAVGLILTLIGIYGVVSYSVSQRTQEMGIRIALGARPGNVLRLVLGQGVRLALLGAAAGLAGSLLLMRLLASQLYEIKPGDPVTLAGAALLMLVVALGASYLPARRATKVDPMVALRFE